MGVKRYLLTWYKDKDVDEGPTHGTALCMQAGAAMHQGHSALPLASSHASLTCEHDFQEICMGAGVRRLTRLAIRSWWLGSLAEADL